MLSKAASRIVQIQAGAVDPHLGHDLAASPGGVLLLFSSTNRIYCAFHSFGGNFRDHQMNLLSGLAGCELRGQFPGGSARPAGVFQSNKKIKAVQPMREVILYTAGFLRILTDVLNLLDPLYLSILVSILVSKSGTLR